MVGDHTTLRNRGSNSTCYRPFSLLSGIRSKVQSLCKINLKSKKVKKLSSRQPQQCTCTTGSKEEVPSTVPSQTKDTHVTATDDPFGRFSQSITLSIGKASARKILICPMGTRSTFKK